MIRYKEFDNTLIERVKEIYALEGWTAYLNSDEKLINAFDNSLYCLGAFDGDKLVGFIRCVGDGEHILLVQDLIVDKAYQKQGIGRRIVETLEQDEFFLRARRIEIPASVTAVEFYKKMGYSCKDGVTTPDEEGLIRLEKFR